MRQETELFFASLVREDRSVLDLLNADYTFVNERLARINHVPDNVTGTEFRRVPLPPTRLPGILTQGSILMMTSVADRTSPVQRGKWVMQVMLGSPPPPPPPNVPALEETGGRRTGDAVGPATDGGASQEPGLYVVPPRHRSAGPGARELRRHRPVPRSRTTVCRWMRRRALRRERRSTAPTACASALLKYKDALLASFTESLMTYALGRQVESYDMPTIRDPARRRQAGLPEVSTFIRAGQEPGVPDEPSAARRTTVADARSRTAMLITKRTCPAAPS